MIYQPYQAQADATDPVRALSGAAAALLDIRWPGVSDTLATRNFVAGCAILARVTLSHRRPAFNIDSVQIGNREVAVEEQEILATPFCSLLRFKKDIAGTQPRLLLVAPMSGHFATLLRATVLTLLPEHDVYITDWRNARDIPWWHGRFDLESFIEHLILFLERLEDSHLVAICQPSVPALAAVASMAEAGNPAQPRTMTLMAGPIDTRISPTKVNQFATSRSLAWFERNLITNVPLRYAGAFRRVYPGFLQLAGFMGMNAPRHLKSCVDQFTNIVRRDTAKAASVRAFYQEYFAVMDLSAEFYLDTIRAIFQEHDLPRGRLRFHGRPVDPGAIRQTWLLTVEGEKDDICAIGQTLAAQDLCAGIRPSRKRHHVQTGVGHYGVFNGRRWQQEIYPILRDLIHAGEAAGRVFA
jgi:poly(3-hydroxybutyrate) depolymerase